MCFKHNYMSEQLEAKRETSEFVCDVCGFKALNRKGLAGHKRLTHKSPTKDDASRKYLDEALSETIKTMADLFKVQQKQITDLQNGIKRLADYVGVCPNVPFEKQNSLGANIMKIYKALSTFQTRYLEHEDVLHYVLKCLDDKGILDIKTRNKGSDSSK